MSEVLTKRVYDIRAARKNPHYDWMHPSWRDLVIDHLASSPKARIEFLRCCGRHGIQLALSKGGGAQGRRYRPLLVTQEDWQTLQVNIKTRTSNETKEAVHAILSSIEEAILHETGLPSETTGSSKDNLHSIAKDATSILRTRWDKGNTVIPIEILLTYCRITEVLDPLPPMPRLIPTWKAYWEAAQEELTYNYTETELSTYSIGKWIDLAECISKSEPRMLTQIKFPACSLEAIQQFLKTASELVEGEAVLRTKSEYESEIELLSEFKIIDRLGGLISSFSDQAVGLSDEVASKRSRLEDELNECFPEPDYEGDDTRPSGGISIEEILSDL